MPSPLHDIPQDADTVAAVRQLCDERGYPAGCSQKLCKRTGRCRGRWIADPCAEEFRVPHCLMVTLDVLHGAIGEAEGDLYQIESAVAAIRNLPDPEDAPGSRFYEPEEADDPSATADYARWAG